MSKPIDPELLKQLALNPDNGINEICRGLGMSQPTFYAGLKAEPDLKHIYDDARAIARQSKSKTPPPPEGDGTGARPEYIPPPKKKSRKASKKPPKKTRQAIAPPRNGHAKGGMTPELLRRVKHEFEHIALYESFTDHFEEIRQEVAAIQG